nr:YitT family protein [Microbacterium radiodurans]
MEASRAPSTGPSLVFEAALTRHTRLEDAVGILTGTFVASLGLHLLQSSGSVTGGTAGLALLLGYATGWSFPLLFAVVNAPFAALALWKKGLSFTLRTFASIALVSGFTWVHQHLLVFERIEPVYGTLGGNLLAGVGLLILFRHRSSLGGVNIIALVLQERTGFSAGWTQMIFDILIIVAALLVLPWPAVLLSAAGAVVLSVVLILNHRPGRYIGR